MKTSESQAALSPALFLAKSQFPKIAKNKKGQAGNRPFNYAPLDAILDACDPVLRDCGLMITQGTDGHELVTRLEHAASGEWRETRMPINADHANMQSYGIEVTYRRRYSVQLILGIVTEEDIDIKEKARAKGVDHTKQETKTDASLEAFISDVRREELIDCAMTMLSLQDEGRELEASRMYYALPSNEEKLFVWSQFKGGGPGKSTPGSKLRSFIKTNAPQKDTE